MSGNGVASATDIASALSKHQVRTRVQEKVEDKPTPELKIYPVGEFQPCRFCNRTDFKSNQSRSAHVAQCTLNPKRKEITRVCERCGVDIATRGYNVHLTNCSGDPAETIRVIALRRDLKLRKAKAQKKGKKFQPLWGGQNRGRVVEITDDGKANINYDAQALKNSANEARREAWREAKRKQRANEMPKTPSSRQSTTTKVDRTEVNVSLEDLKTIMATRFAPSMGSRYREFIEWCEKTEKLWESV
jgi:hypothetical protein